MTDFLVTRIARPPSSGFARVALGLACAALALGLRLALVPYLGMGTPFVALLLAVVVASVFGGVAGGTACLLLLAVAGPLLLPPDADPFGLRRRIVGELIFVASGATVIWITALARAALRREIAGRETERLLRLELQHRVKNTLAVVQSVADQTFRNTSDPHVARRDFADRLVALAQAHDALVDSGWEAVTLDALAERALAPFRPAASERLVLEGAAAPVPPDAAVPLALCLHELATNAAKYGALSGEDGRVRLSWRLEADGRRLALDWAESGGPTVVPPVRQGFGTRLLTRALAARPNAEARLTFPAQGVHWVARFDLEGV
ncbi:MAG: sensor histidine kinase [Caulobacterales bacterium]|nr:sensor histidine kinase [Caulobacterales bacterium]